MNIDIQSYIDKFGCKYFAVNDTSDGVIVSSALRSNLIRLYALNRHPEIVKQQRVHFQENERIQIFNWTHPESWDEVIRLMPVDQPSMFWVCSTEIVAPALRSLSRLRPAHKDIVFVEPGSQRGSTTAVERYFSRTHNILSVTTDVLLLSPKKVRNKTVE